MPISDPVDGFRLSYDDHRADDHPADSDVVVLLHGWPGDRHDYRTVLPLLAGRCRVLVPDLRGFGETRGSAADPAACAADAQAASVLALVERVGPVVLAGYDVGSRVAQAAARVRPDLVRALVVAPPMPGAGSRVLAPQAQREFWYQAFHQLSLVEQLLDGDPEAVRAYLGHFWSHWSGPGFEVDPADLDRLAESYGRPGAFVSSINWYRAGAGMVARSVQERAPDPEDRSATPTTVLWPEHDPLFPQAWSDRIEEHLADVEVRFLGGVGHFVPLEAPAAFAAAVLERCGSGQY